MLCLYRCERAWTDVKWEIENKLFFEDYNESKNKHLRICTHKYMVTSSFSYSIIKVVFVIYVQKFEFKINQDSFYYLFIYFFFLHDCKLKPCLKKNKLSIGTSDSIW